MTEFDEFEARRVSLYRKLHKVSRVADVLDRLNAVTFVKMVIFGTIVAFLCAHFGLIALWWVWSFILLMGLVRFALEVCIRFLGNRIKPLDLQLVQHMWDQRRKS